MKTKSILLGAFLMSSICAYASNYPVGYMNQSALAASNGAAVLAQVKNPSSSIPKYVVAYKKGGMLAKISDHVNVYIKAHYQVTSHDGSWSESRVAEKRVKLLPEYHGNGYISGELPLYTAYGTDGLIFMSGSLSAYVEIEKVELAFYVNDKWDSNGGMNYVFTTGDLQRGVRFTSAYSSQNIAIDTWEFIVGQMAK